MELNTEEPRRSPATSLSQSDSRAIRDEAQSAAVGTPNQQSEAAGMIMRFATSSTRCRSR